MDRSNLDAVDVIPASEETDGDGVGLLAVVKVMPWPCMVPVAHCHQPWC